MAADVLRLTEATFGSVEPLRFTILAAEVAGVARLEEGKAKMTTVLLRSGERLAVKERVVWDNSEGWVVL
jgi:hypothetical protein